MGWVFKVDLPNKTLWILGGMYRLNPGVWTLVQ